MELKDGQKIPVFVVSEKNGDIVKRSKGIRMTAFFKFGLPHLHHVLTRTDSHLHAATPVSQFSWLYVWAYGNLGIILI